jgi:hypothetical protein
MRVPPGRDGLDRGVGHRVGAPCGDRLRGRSARQSDRCGDREDDERHQYESPAVQVTVGVQRDRERRQRHRHHQDREQLAFAYPLPEHPRRERQRDRQATGRERLYE